MTYENEIKECTNCGEEDLIEQNKTLCKECEYKERIKNRAHLVI